MTAIAGSIIPFDEYLNRAGRKPDSCAFWKSTLIDDAVAESDLGERGSLALVHPDLAGGVTAAPGLSVTVQVVEPDGATKLHSHSFWHLLIVRSGVGRFSNGDGEVTSIGSGDLLFVPAWSNHTLVSASSIEPLVLVSIQNLPALAELGSIARRDGNGPIRVVYAGRAD